MDSCSPFWTADSCKCLKWEWSGREQLTLCACKILASELDSDCWLLVRASFTMQRTVWGLSVLLGMEQQTFFSPTWYFYTGTTASGLLAADKDSSTQRWPWMSWECHSFQIRAALYSQNSLEFCLLCLACCNLLMELECYKQGCNGWVIPGRSSKDLKQNKSKEERASKYKHVISEVFLQHKTHTHITI